MTHPRVLVVTNFATHYRAPLFELLHERLGAEFLFFSEGGEDYWQPHLGVTEGRFPATTAMGGPGVGKVRFNSRLLRELRSRDFDVVVKCMNGRGELPLTYAMARHKGAAFVLWTGMWMHPQTVFHSLSQPLVRGVYRHSDAIVTYGTHVSKFVIGEGADARSVFEAENATDNTLYSRAVSTRELHGVRSRYGIPEGKVVLAVSRLVAQKGLETLVDSIGLLPGPRPCLVIVGTGPLKAELEMRAAARDVPIVMIGGVQPQELAPLYALANVFVMASVRTRTFLETWGLACNEAMCQATPVIATTSVGAVAGGLIVDGETGIVVPERDTDTLATALRRVLGSPEYSAELGRRGRERITLTSFDNMADGFERAIRHALARREANS